MQNALSKLTRAIFQYMEHRLHARIKTAAIKKIKEEMKADPFTVLIVIGHKQKILQMKYRECQVEYYGKKGMSVLGAMIMQWTEVENANGFEYRFRDYIFQGYAGQDNVQVAGALENIVMQVKQQYPKFKIIIF